MAAIFSRVEFLFLGLPKRFLDLIQYFVACDSWKIIFLFVRDFSTLLAIIDKYGFLISEWALLYQALLMCLAPK